MIVRLSLSLRSVRLLHFLIFYARIGDIIDEAVKSKRSCRLAVKVLEGGGGFSKINCCGLELTVADKVDSIDESIARYPGKNARSGVIIDESKNYSDSCGLKVEIVAGGKCFNSIICCGNELTIKNDLVEE